MDGAQVEYLGRKLDRLVEVFEHVLAEVQWSHRDDPMPMPGLKSKDKR